MTPPTGQAKKVNGDWKKLMFQIYGAGAVFIVFIGAIWWQVLLPNQQAFTRNAETLTEQIPKQTQILEEIRDQGVKTSTWQQSVLDDHARQNGDHLEILDKLNQ